MDDREIRELIEDYERYSLPRSLMMRTFALALVNSSDPMFLLKVPEPFRSD